MPMIQELMNTVDYLHGNPDSSFVFMMLKPLGMSPKVRSQILGKIEMVGTVAWNGKVKATKDQVEAHYESIKYNKEGKVNPHYYPITSYLTNQDMEVFVVEDFLGMDAKEFIKAMRDIVGKSNPMLTQNYQIRNLALTNALPYRRVLGQVAEGSNTYCMDNLVHCSDSLDAAIKEISIWTNGETTKKYYARYERIRHG